MPLFEYTILCSFLGWIGSCFCLCCKGKLGVVSVSTITWIITVICKLLEFVVYLILPNFLGLGASVGINLAVVYIGWPYSFDF